MVDVSALLDLDRGLVSPGVFTRTDVYRAELERVFARCWLFVAHESQLERTGDFFTTSMGTERVIAVRDGHGELRVLANSCRHRGGVVCREDTGNCGGFTCPYHRWSYDLTGKLTGVPHRKRAYGARFEAGQWDLIAAERVETYRGLIFASFDPEAPPLLDYLCDTRWYLDVLLDQTAGGLVALPGVQKWRVRTNWKLPAEQFAGDTGHAGGVHASLGGLGYDVGFGDGAKGDFVARLKGGHGWIHLAARARPLLSEFEQGVREQAAARLSEHQLELLDGLHIATVFPNLSLVSYPGFVNFRLWQPRGPGALEIWSWCLTHREAPAETRTKAQKMLTRMFSPSGIFEQDDLEVWEGCSRTLEGPVRSRYDLCYGQLENRPRPDSPFPGEVYAPPSDQPLLGFYDTWSEYMHGGTDDQ